MTQYYLNNRRFYACVDYCITDLWNDNICFAVQLPPEYFHLRDGVRRQVRMLATVRLAARRYTIQARQGIVGSSTLRVITTNEVNRRYLSFGKMARLSYRNCAAPGDGRTNCRPRASTTWAFGTSSPHRVAQARQRSHSKCAGGSSQEALHARVCHIPKQQFV